MIAQLEGQDQRSIIMITYDQSIFFVNNEYKKVWTLNG